MRIAECAIRKRQSEFRDSVSRRSRCTEGRLACGMGNANCGVRNPKSAIRNSFCLCVLLFARFPNVLLQNKTADCEKWQEKPLPIRGHGRQRSIDIQDSLESRVIRSSANADFELPARTVRNLNQGR